MGGTPTPTPTASFWRDFSSSSLTSPATRPAQRGRPPPFSFPAMQGTWCVAGRTRSRRALAAAAAAEANGHVESPSAPARDRRRGRGGARGAPPKPPDPGRCAPAREVAVIVLDDDDDGEDDAEAGEKVCGGRGAGLHVEVPPRGDRVRADCPLAARAMSSLEPSHYGDGAAAAGVAVGFDGSSSSSVSLEPRAAENPSGSVAACSEVSRRSISGGVVSELADEVRSEATVSVHGGGEDSAELDHCVGAVAGSCGGPSPGNDSREIYGSSSGYSLSTHGNSAGVEVESGGSSACGTGTKQMESQSFNASSEPAPPERGDGAGAETIAEAGGTTSNEESGSKTKHNRGVPGSQDVADSHGGMRNLESQQRNCVARRTRSKLFGDKYRKIVYTTFFKDSGSSDSDGEEADSDTEETRLWTPPSSASLLSLSSSSSSESKYESDHSDDGWMNTKDQLVNGRQLADDYDADGKLAAKRGMSSCKGNPFSTDGKKGRVDDSVSTDSTRTAWQSHLCFSEKHGKSKQKGPSGKTVPSPAHNEWENNTGSDRRSSDEKPAKVRESDVDDCFEGEKTVPHKMQQRTKQHEAHIGKFKNRKRLRALKSDTLFKVFIDTIWGKVDAFANEAPPPKDEILSQVQTSVKNKEPLPLIFSFGDEDPKPVEKSEYEKALDELWAEFDFVLNTNEIGKYKPHECEHEYMDVDEDQNHHSCNNGTHQFVLDEQIGIKCKLCSFVSLEIRYIPPVMATEHSDRMFGRPIWGKQDGLPQFDGLFVSENEEMKGDGFELSKGTVWDLIPGVRSTLYPHQQEAFEFMWRNLAGDIFLNNLKGSACYDGLGGCVISHAPGTGKSRLTIVFIQAFLGVFPECRPVIVAPRGMLLTWKKEFEKWKIDIPVHVLNEHQFSGTEDEFALSLVLGVKRKRHWSRIVKLFSWDKGRSILALSYCLFEKLVGSLNKQGTKNAYLGKILLDKPDLFVFDEGHTPRNERSLIWKALRKIRTERRIILSGTPFQNNFGELYNTFCLVRPKFADRISCEKPQNGQRKEFMMENEENTPLARDEGRGKWASLTSSITDERLEELRLMMKPFVHVHNGSSLRCLPGLKDCLIVLDPLPRQKSVLEVVEDVRSDTTFAMEYKTCLASVHPSLLTACTLSEKESSEIDIRQLESIRLNPNEGVKTRFVMELVRLCQPLHERVLVFSQYIEPLDLIVKQLELPFGWKEGTDILKMDGKIRPRHRQSLIDAFNDSKSKARVLLASIKACCEGISLTGASRVVLLDVVWNPSVERQAISRAYRLGQEKVVYIYHLITYGTREGDKYYKQVEKDRLSKLVFSSADGHKTVQDDSLAVSEDKILKEMVGHDKLQYMFKRILYQPKQSNLIDAFMF